MIIEFITSGAARLGVYGILLGTAAVCHAARVVGFLLRLKPQEERVGNQRLLLAGTFYNAGWFRSHIAPLSACGALVETIVLCDEPLFPVDNVRYDCPPPGMVRVCGRSLSRLLWLLYIAWRYRPDIFMGYHIMPNALMCLAVAKITGRRAFYQMTGGPIQLVGGGVGSENVLLRQIKTPSPRLEALLFHVVRQFDYVIVRGKSAEAFVAEHRLGANCAIITGSVDTDRFSPYEGEKDIDVVCVARLIAYKGVERCVEVLAAVAKICPGLRAVIAGGGHLMETLVARTRELGLDGCIEFPGKVDDVEKLLRRSRLFLLMSPSEGMSIAMLEAMAAGLPAVVTNVGDLSDIVQDGASGLLLDSPTPDHVAPRILELLGNHSLLSRMAEAAREAVVERASVQSMTARWDEVLST